jgi:hypothetical protein
LPTTAPDPAAAPPQYWTQAISGEGGTLLTYAVRGGAGQSAVTALGIAFLLGGAYALYWLLAGEGLTVAGALLLLVPAGALLFGVYCLDVTLLARTEHLLGSHGLSVRRISLFGATRTDIPRRAVVAIRQHYSPPGPSAATGAPGDWVTFVACRPDAQDKTGAHAMGGLHTAAEARWLGPLLADWAGVPLERGFAAGFEEADPAELPDPDAPAR